MKNEKGPGCMKNLNDVLSSNQKAKQYFLTLPENVQGALIQNTNQIHNLDDLRFAARKELEKSAVKKNDSF